jgi:two-component system, NarL family, response regulator NreC
MHAEHAFVQEALQGGASAYVPKDAPGAELIRAIREAAAGRRYLSPPLADAMIGAYLERGGQEPADPLDALTAREREVLHLSAQGLTSKDIARRLAISSRTAESHRASLMRKLGLHGQTDLIRFALKRGILPQDSP